MKTELLNPRLAEFWPVTETDHRQGWKEIRVEFRNGGGRMVRINAAPDRSVLGLLALLSQETRSDAFVEKCLEPGKGQSLLPLMPQEIANLTFESDAMIRAVCVVLTFGLEYADAFTQVMELVQRVEKANAGINPKDSRNP